MSEGKPNNMYLKPKIVTIIVLSYILLSIVVSFPNSGVDKGITCAVCTVLASILFEHPDEYNSSQSQAWGVKDLCNSLYMNNETLEYMCIVEAQNDEKVYHDGYFHAHYKLRLRHL